MEPEGGWGLRDPIDQDHQSVTMKSGAKETFFGPKWSESQTTDGFARPDSKNNISFFLKVGVWDTRRRPGGEGGFGGSGQWSFWRRGPRHNQPSI